LRFSGHPGRRDSGDPESRNAMILDRSWIPGSRDARPGMTKIK
jgi:hypothetical protein